MIVVTKVMRISIQLNTACVRLAASEKINSLYPTAFLIRGGHKLPAVKIL